MLNDAVRALWPLSENFEYAAEVGLAARNLAPGWWRRFEADVDRGRFPLPQALGYRFVQYLEASADVDRDEVVGVLATALGGGDPRLLEELDASLACAGRDYTPREDPFDAPALDGERVALWRPGACAGYPDASTLWLDDWTLQALDGADVEDRDSAPASVQALARAHSRFYVQGLLGFAAAGGGRLTPETAVTADGADSALAAAGALIAASRYALSAPASERRVPVCLVRPGSHHAERARGGGTCLVNNLAVAAHDALRHGVGRVAIVDLDAHHGNGTEDIFREDPRVLTVSVHQAGPFFPGTGHADETGTGAGRGTNLNLPVGAHDDWLDAVRRGVGRVMRHRPGLVLVEFSADAHRADAVSDLRVCDDEFEEAVGMLEAVGVPVVYELGASSSQRAWVGAVRGLVRAAGR